MPPITIPGATSDIAPDDRPAIGVFGAESSGKSRFAATAPGTIGLLALDKKSKRTFQSICAERSTEVVVNEKPFLSDKDAIKMAMITDTTAKSISEIRNTYTEALDRIFSLAMAYASHPEIKTIVVDTCSQLFDVILFSHFGRRNQITPTSRGAANQDMIDFINALRCKNLVLIHRAKEIWKSTGQTDKDGRPIKEPSGRFEQDGFKHIGAFLTANLELTSKRTATDLDSKFRAKVVTSQYNVLIEGQDLSEYGIMGSEITWDNVITVLGLYGEAL